MSMPVCLVITYAVFCGLYFPIHWVLAGTAVSALLTMAGLFQCIGFAMLVVQTLAYDSTKGISASSLELKLLALICRLSNTMWFQGYLPYDATGDGLFQSLDFISLGFLLWLLYRIHGVERYVRKYTQHQTGPSICMCILLAVIFHGNMSSQPLCDTLWMVSVFLAVAAEFPQLCLITTHGSRARILTGHYFACMVVSCLLKCAVQWVEYDDLKFVPYIDGFNQASCATMSAHAVHVILLADFIYYYIRAIWTRIGIGGTLDFDGSFQVCSGLPV